MPRKSTITKSVRRVYNTAKFESLEIVVHYDEEVEWDKIPDRQEKSDKITQLLLLDFGVTKKAVFEKMGLSEKKATVTNKVDNVEKDFSVEELGLDDIK